MADLEAVVRDLETKGVTFIDHTEGPLVTMGHIAQFGPARPAWIHDPDGNTLGLGQVLRVTFNSEPDADRGKMSSEAPHLTGSVATQWPGSTGSQLRQLSRDGSRKGQNDEVTSARQRPAAIDLRRRRTSREYNSARNVVFRARLGNSDAEASCNLLDEDRQQQLLDYAQKLIEEQRTERGRAATV